MKPQKPLIKTAQFITSSPTIKECPKPDYPEYAFVGRSNVGKSSLINALTNHSKLAKTSSTPGKTQLINHFLIDDSWYLVDLPGYGYAKVSKKEREKFDAMMKGYLSERENLVCTFVLIDSRIDPQKNDLEFMEWLGENQVPFVMVFTKADKVKPQQKENFLKKYQSEMAKVWEFMPEHFFTSSAKKEGLEELHGYIMELNQQR